MGEPQGEHVLIYYKFYFFICFHVGLFRIQVEQCKNKSSSFRKIGFIAFWASLLMNHLDVEGDSDCDVANNGDGLG